jgi:dipeptide/tripeptide permease
MSSFYGLITLGAINLFERTALYILMAVIINYLTTSLGLSYTDAGTIYSIFYAATYVPVIISGLLGDFTKRKILISIGIVTMLIGYIMLVTPMSNNTTIISIILVIIGLGSGILKPNIIVAFGNSFNNNSNKKHIGFLIFSISSSIGSLIALMLSSYLSETIGIKGVIIVSLVSLVIATVLFFIMSKTLVSTLDTYKINRTLPPKVNKGSNLFMLLSVLLLTSPLINVINQTGISFNLISSGLNNELGNLMSKFMILNPLSTTVAGAIILFIVLQINKRVKLFNSISLGLLVYAFAYIILISGIVMYNTNVNFLFIAFPVIITAIGEIFIYPAILTTIHNSAPTKLRGLFMGIYLTLYGTSNFMISKFIELYDKHGHTIYLSVIILLLIGLAAIFFVLNIINNQIIKQQR